ncbi:MAG: hypothetical protein J7562_03535 [Agrobacterium tumefaciens]|nr:hypothetical protein [Agrobacterium tumefaciens]
MTYREVLEGKSIAVSTSDSPDMAGLGLQMEHLRDAMAEIARHMLALGAKLVYGGDLRTNGFSNLLFELAARYRRDSRDRTTSAVTNYLAWPVHIVQQPEQIDQFVADLQGVAELRLLDIDGKPLDLRERHNMQTLQPTEPEWARGLSAMRHTMMADTHARIILGGRVDKFKGEMPGLAEEALYSLQGHQPLYVMGGFGGCARDIAEAIGTLDSQIGRDWLGREKFAGFKGYDLNNGLSHEENRILARTPHVDQAIILILKGLTNVLNRSHAL